MGPKNSRCPFTETPKRAITPLPTGGSLLLENPSNQDRLLQKKPSQSPESHKLFQNVPKWFPFTAIKLQPNVPQTPPPQATSQPKSQNLTVRMPNAEKRSAQVSLDPEVQGSNLFGANRHGPSPTLPNLDRQSRSFCLFPCTQTPQMDRNSD